MNAFCKVLVLSAFLLPAGAAALAQEATPQGAARLTETFQTYLGRIPGVVSVMANGSGYEARIDFSPFVTLTLDGSGTAKMSPLVLALTDRGDGLWDVALDQPVSLDVDVPRQQQMVLDITSLKMTGVFDEALQTMRRSVIDLNGLSVTQVITGPDNLDMTSLQKVAAVHQETLAEAAAAGGVDLTSAMVMTGLAQSQTLPLGEEGAPVEIGITTARYEADVVANGLRMDRILDAFAYLVAHPSAAEVTATQEDLRRLLAAALPVLDGATTTSLTTDISLQTPVGSFGLHRLASATEMTGIVPEGRLQMSATLEGLSLPAEMVEPWEQDFVPQRLSLDLEVTGFDLAGPVAILIDDFDLTRPEPLDAGAQTSLLAALLPGGTVRVRLAPGALTAPLYDLGYGGDVTFGPAAMPVGQATITLKGYNALYSAMQASPDPDMAELLQMLAVAQGLAQHGDNLLTWGFALSADGHVTLNGMDMGPVLEDAPTAAP